MRAMSAFPGPEADGSLHPRQLGRFGTQGLWAPPDRWRRVDPLELKIVRTMGIRPYGPRPQDREVLRGPTTRKVSLILRQCRFRWGRFGEWHQGLG